LRDRTGTGRRRLSYHGSAAISVHSDIAIRTHQNTSKLSPCRPLEGPPESPF